MSLGKAFLTGTLPQETKPGLSYGRWENIYCLMNSLCQMLPIHPSNHPSTILSSDPIWSSAFWMLVTGNCKTHIFIGNEDEIILCFIFR